LRLRGLRAAAAAAGLLLSGAAAAQGQDAARWRQLADADVEAAHALLAQDHPGALPEVGDADFRRRLAAGRDEARRRAAQVTSYAGYAATLQGFANAMGDRHIWSRSLGTVSSVEWAGLIAARRGGHWVVADEDGASDGPPLTGARLVSCDGAAADVFAERRLGGFSAIWSVPAQRTAAAPLLFVDDGNPFLARPARCVFDQGGAPREVALRWRTADKSALEPRLAAAVRQGAPGFGVRRSGAGYWIALQSLNETAQPVVAAVQAQAAALRRAPYVVLDMRGNGGGNSHHGDLILQALLGPRALADPRSRAIACSSVWRISPRNLAVLRAASREPGHERAYAAYWQREYRRAAAAAAAGRSLSGPPACAARTSGDERRAPPPRSLFPGRLIVLTDHACFSSCILVTDQFRRLGALHTGEATDAMTRYFEVREETLPSGLSAFSTLQALSPSSPPQIGPLVPHRVYEGDISDTAALERWAATLVQTGDDR
jgi:hypothetical protein